MLTLLAERFIINVTNNPLIGGINMILTIITAIICFIAAVIMLSPYFRKIPLLRPMACYLIFEGACVIFSYLISEINPTSLLPSYINQIGTIIIISYYIFIMFMTRTKSKNKKRTIKSKLDEKKA